MQCLLYLRRSLTLYFGLVNNVKYHAIYDTNSYIHMMFLPILGYIYSMMNANFCSVKITKSHDR